MEWQKSARFGNGDGTIRTITEIDDGNVCKSDISEIATTVIEKICALCDPECFVTTSIELDGIRWNKMVMMIKIEHTEPSSLR